MKAFLFASLVLVMSCSVAPIQESHMHADQSQESDKLLPGEVMYYGHRRVSADGRVMLTMQPDGNLVLYYFDQALWSSGTFGKFSAHATLQTDGNLIIKEPDGSEVFTSGTWGDQYAGAELVVQNDGNLVLYKNGLALWATGTHVPENSPNELQSCFQGNVWACDVEQKIVELTNAHRAGLNLPSLRVNAELSFAAGVWSGELAGTKTVNHDGFPDQRNDSIQSQFPGSPVRVAAENVAEGSMQSNASQVAESLTRNWWNSVEHKNNMLSNNSWVGIGVVVRGRTVYATQLFAR